MAKPVLPKMSMKDHLIQMKQKGKLKGKKAC